jgi:hypothetical protein
MKPVELKAIETVATPQRLLVADNNLVAIFWHNGGGIPTGLKADGAVPSLYGCCGIASVRENWEREKEEKRSSCRLLKKFKSHLSSVTIITQNVYYDTIAQTSIPCTTRKARKMCLMPQRYQIDHYYKRAQNWYYMSWRLYECVSCVFDSHFSPSLLTNNAVQMLCDQVTKLAVLLTHANITQKELEVQKLTCKNEIKQLKVERLKLASRNFWYRNGVLLWEGNWNTKTGSLLYNNLKRHFQ